MDAMQAALMAQKDATDAKHTAEKAAIQITSHEMVCAQRYENIKEKLDSLPDIFQALERLQTVSNRAIGIWLATSGLAVILGIVGAIWAMKP